MGQPPPLTRRRVVAAFAVGIAADLAQLAAGPFGWALADQAIDVVAAAAVWPLLGFHPLLLPTFVLELVPVVGAFPTWTACVAVVVARRKREERP